MGNVKSLRDERHVDKMFYIQASKLFYEPVDKHCVASDECISLVKSIYADVESKWSIWRKGVWTYVQPRLGDGSNLPMQGWKIHVSATEKNCLELLNKVARIALANELEFKFANDIATLRMMTSKRWSRGGSGKFITIYPQTEAIFRSALELLYAEIKDYHGSYILSDSRYKDCRCLYYRYGSFIENLRMDFMGRREPILTSPAGDEVVDIRTPYFSLPPWLDDPFPQVDEDQGKMTLNNGRFEIRRALAFSNTGGVYLAFDTKTQREVVIKEARPYVELHGEDKDAVSRLKKEEKMLRLLDGLGVAPKPIESFWDWENFYLAEEYIEHTDIRDIMLINSPLLKTYPTVSDSENFYEIFRKIFVSLMSAVDKVHSQGIVLADLSAVNFLVVKDTFEIRIIDLEAAFKPGTDDPTGISTPGFHATEDGRDHVTGYDGDLYGIAALMMYCMFPIVAMSYVRNDLLENVFPTLVYDAGWSKTPVLDIVRGLASNTMTCQKAIELLERPAACVTPYSVPREKVDPSPREAYHELASFLQNHYRLEEKYSLFPVDPFALQTNAEGLAFGNSGVMCALSKCGFSVTQEATKRYFSEIDKLSMDLIAPGFATGAAGIALALLEMGDQTRARKFINAANASPLKHAHHSLFYGMAGIGMVNLKFYRDTGDKGFLHEATKLGEVLLGRAIRDEKGLHWEHDGATHLGLGYGQSGVALFYLRLSQALSSEQWRRIGEEALAFDVSYRYELEDGVFTFPTGPDDQLTYEQYVEEGSAGIAKVLIRYGQWEYTEKILEDIHRKYSAFAGLYFGMSGFLDALVDAYLYTRNKKYFAMAEKPYHGIIDLFYTRQGVGHATPGDNLFRISCDYATGVAGVMRTIYRYDHLELSDFLLDEFDDLDVSGLSV